MEERIKEMLRSTNREGVEELIEYMEQSGFFTCPASTKYHMAKQGGLAEHSLNVMNIALDVAKTMGYENRDSIIIVSLLHDLGKTGQFGKPLYVDNVLKTGISKAQPYKTNPELKALPHEITSIVEAFKRIELTEDEQMAICYHNGLYGDFRYEIQGKENELYLILHFADMWASRITEVEDE